MKKSFNVSADCKPGQHYMVNLSSRLEQVKAMVDQGAYFTINRARQYGKTTLLKALGKFLEKDYTVINLDFQMISHTDFQKEKSFAAALSMEILDVLEDRKCIPESIRRELAAFADGAVNDATLSKLFRTLNKWCRHWEKKIVLIIDEVDSASNNQVFLDFLALLRGSYINRDRRPTFHSVILASVYDIKNLKQKLASDGTYRLNSPWNIAADFLVNLGFSVKDIAGMLSDYEKDCQTEMDIEKISQMIYDYSGGYPFLVSRLCKLIDEQIAGSPDFPDRHSAWTKSGFLEAVRILLDEKNTLFDSLAGKIHAYPALEKMIYSLLFLGQDIVYNPDDDTIGLALMFGFVKISGGSVCIANRIFETRLYNFFLTAPQTQESSIYWAATENKNLFIENGRLNMRLVLEKFVRHFDDLYGDQEQAFHEDDGRRYFLLYLRPIINGSGNYYIEAQTRNRERTDVIIDYGGEQIIIELKIWHGNAYHMKGEKQSLDYLEYYHLDKGYMLSFNFNKHKEIGIKEISLGSKVLIEAVV